MLFLGYMEKKQRDTDENFWSIYFVAPLSSDDHRFVIDSRSSSTAFRYDIMINEQIIDSKEITIKRKDHVIITPSEIRSLPFSIIVSHDDKKQELTKK